MEYDLRYAQGFVRDIPEDAEETRTVTFVISTPDRDRHRSILNPDGWHLDNYHRNPIVGYQHNVYGDMCTKPDPDDVIGTSRVYLDGDKLMGEVTFEPGDENPLAEKIFKKVLRGTLRSASVGFYPIKNEKGESGNYGSAEKNEHKGGANETFYFFGQELIEWSLVNVPSNPKANGRALRAQTASALMFIKRELNLPFSDIERLRVFDVVDMLENPNSNRKTKSQIFSEFISDLIGNKLSNEEIEKLTVKGVINIINGDVVRMVEEDTGQKLSPEVINMLFTLNKNSLKL